MYKKHLKILGNEKTRTGKEEKIQLLEQKGEMIATLYATSQQLW